MNGLSLLLDVSDVGMYESRRPDDSSSLCMNIIPIRMRIHMYVSLKKWDVCIHTYSTPITRFAKFVGL